MDLIITDYIYLDEIVDNKLVPKEDIHKVVMIDYWGSIEGYKKIIFPYQHWTPFPYPKNVFVGFFFEHVCPKEIVPPSNRSDYGMIWGKSSMYFYFIFILFFTFFFF